MISHYGVLVGTPQGEFEKGKHPRLYINLDTKESTLSRVAVNILDYSGKNVMFCAINELKAKFVPNLLKLDYGSYDLAPNENAGAIDYFRGGFVEQQDFKEKTKEELEAILANQISPYVGNKNGSKIYFVGSRFPEGIHDIHMNQGEESEAFKWQDGAIIIKDVNKDNVSGLFFYFQEQKWPKPAWRH